MPIALKVLLTVLLSLALALALVVGLNILKLDSFLREVNAERASILLSDLGNTAGAAYDVGLPLADLTATGDLRRRGQAKGGDLQDILLFDHEGRILQSGDTAQLGERVPEAWLQRQRLAGPDSWSVAEERQLAVGLGLQSSFGTTIGSVAVVISEEGQRADVLAALRHLGLAALAIFLAAAAVALPVSLVLSRRLRLLVQALDDGIAGAPVASARAIEPLTTGFGERVREAESALASIERPERPQ